MSVHPIPTPGRRGSRTAAGVCLIAAASVFMASVSLWPHGSDADTQTMLRAAAGHPTAWMLANLCEEISGALAVAGAIGVSRWLSGRGRTLGLLGAIGSVLGLIAFAVSATGNMFVLTLAQRLPGAQAGSLQDAFFAQPYVTGHLPLFYLNAVGAILLAVGAVRGRLLPWWVLILVGVGLVLNFGLLDGQDAPITSLGYLPMFAATTILGVRLIRARQPHSAGRTEPAVQTAESEPATAVPA